jgi:hypothetical protein
VHAHVLGPAAQDDLAVLRARPTGMEEDAWRKRRREIAAELGDRRDDATVEALLEIVKTERYDAVLSIAIESLGKIGDPRAIGPLQQIQADRSLDEFVREDAAAALAALGAKPRATAGDPAALVAGGDGDPVLGGPQLGTMGEASVAPEDTDDPTRTDKSLPKNLRARTRDISFVLGRLDLGVNTLSSQQPVLADGGLAARARYIDERHRWGWSVIGDLSGRIRNGDVTAAPEMGEDTGNTLYVGQALAGSGEAHVYFGKTDVHAFGQLGLSQRLARVSIDDIGDGMQSNLSDTRFALDVVPAGGLGYGRFLGRGSDLLVDAVVTALRDENNLAKPPTPDDRRALRDALYRRSNTFSSWPRTQAVLAVLRARGLVARRPGARLVHRIRSVVEDPSYVDRPQGVRVRVGFLYDAPIGQDDVLRRGDAIAAPFAQLDVGLQLGLERQILIDTRLYYDVVGVRGFTTDTGATYTRFLHTKFHDYAGQWHAGVRGGASGRDRDDLADGESQARIGYRAVGQAGYAYGFRRGSDVSIGASCGVDSGGFVLQAALGFRIGLARGSVWNPGSGAARTKGPAAGAATTSKK